ncbi:MULTISPECIES: phospholipase D-like domain-containing protein [unclassified Aureimonas]|uniref:phospholipase D-like domain-containing protein n=1 Tax=unclassified Aureimonas TaxID=2615206 RepID=UPI0006F54F23|nr:MULTISPECIES: phospholipase D-like domain-containing protein [unclassified Aureimonas]KQT53048.1 phospholipase [Aureimonas sp. Leaf427]KQT80504.1 phospholipase [Aureimonas sp. Leaf460]
MTGREGRDKPETVTDAVPSPLVPGRNCQRIERATRASVIVDADDYFRFARAAMLKARRRIVLIGWDFDGRITLGRGGGKDEAPEKVGDFIYWLARNRPELEVYLLRWDLGALKTLTRGSTIFTVLKWMSHPRIHTKLDGAHPFAGSHHQKIVVIDDSFAFCGGIDMTEDRWDTRQHVHEDDRRRRPNGTRYKPWHDATTAVEGPMAEALAAVSRDRWHHAGGRRMEPVEAMPSCWPDDLPVHFNDIDMAVSRSAPDMPGEEAITEIETLYLDQIAGARRLIYAESQYFASRRIAEAIAKRLDEEDGPEIVVINPLTAQGWLEPIAMDTARARLFETLRRRDRHGRFRIYHPFTDGGEAIYVHAKILIVDDRSLRIGSSNMNNRSLRLDTECDVTIDAGLPGNEGLGATILDIRDDLLAEHLGVDVETVTRSIASTGSLIRTIEALRGPGKSLRPYETPDLTAVEEWLADNEVLDPEGPDEMFEALSERGLFRRLRSRLRKAP